MVGDIKNPLLFVCLIVFIVLFSGVCCNSRKSAQEHQANREEGTNTGQDQANSLTSQEKKEGWTLLFDGKSTDKWRIVYGNSFPNKGWVVKNGTLTVLDSNGRQGGIGGSIVTKNSYSNFEFQLEFNLTEEANSGIKYFVVENSDFFEANPAGRGIGLEYQIIDDARPDVSKTMSAASLYDLITPAEGKKLKPPGEWNHAKIISNGYHVEHWLNGKKVLEYKRGNDNYEALVRKSKYSHYKNFGLAPEGHILLQNHGSKVSYRNIKIRKI